MSLLEQQLHLYSHPLRLAEDDSFSKEFILPACFIGFQGHFPDKPILPAVVQAIMARLVLKEAKGNEEAEGELLLAKFLVPIAAGEKIRVEGKGGKGKWQLAFFLNETKVSDIQIRKKL